MAGDTFDVVVIGSGGSGLAAAVSAAENGLSVLVVEKAPHIGGSTALSVGAFTAPNTRYQAAAGIRDSVEEFIEDIRTTNGAREERENTELRRLFAENAGPTLEWLFRLGVRFIGPFPEPPHRHSRLHNVLPNSGAYTAALASRARRLGVEIRLSSPAERLLVGVSGEITGVQLGSGDVIARCGVVIASGDYSANHHIIGANIGGGAEKVGAVNAWNVGDGQRLGEEAGGTTSQMDTVFEGLRYVPRVKKDLLKAMPTAPWFARVAAPFATRLPRRVFEYLARSALVGWLAPSPDMYAAGGIQVTAVGNLLETDGSASALARAVAATGNHSFLVFDEAVAQQFRRGKGAIASFPGVSTAHLEDVRRYRPDLIRSGTTLSELARASGMEPAALEASVAHAGSLSAGPFYALGPLEAIITLANGGLRIDTDFHVLDEQGRPLVGLFAAGSAGQGGLQLLNNGLHIGWAMTSGRLCGKSVASSSGTRLTV